MAAPVTTLHSVCAECGAVYERDEEKARCPECHPAPDRTVAKVLRERSRNRREAGYDAQWDRLSARARRLQPFCSDCGTTEQLTGDHSPEAWRRRALGKPVRLRDIDVVCRACNSARGPARGPDAVERATAGAAMDELENMEVDDLVPDDLDQRIARGEL